jgi:acyl-coenzyme A thioesterase PaaI-like protein
MKFAPNNIVRPFSSARTSFRGTIVTNNLRLRLGHRFYGTRSVNDSPFDHLPFREKPWIRWKTTAFFFLLGSLVAYNETLFNIYESVTTLDEDDHFVTEMLPLQLDYKLKHLPIYEELSHPSNSRKWYKLQSWENLDRNVLDKHDGAQVKTQNEYHTPSLTTHTLAKPGGILIKPVIFHNIETNEGVTIVHMGHRLTGYPFLVHGGIIATLLNETFKRNASLSLETTSNLKDDFKVENLTISYKAPTVSNQFLIVKTKQKESVPCEDRKTITLESTIESQKGKVLVKGTAVLHDTGRATDIMKAENKKWKMF